MYLDDASGFKPVCWNKLHLFYGHDQDGRTEQDRKDREARAAAMCTWCPIRLGCLEDAIVWKERWGVFGGMGEAERRRFVAHLKDEGYTESDMPSGDELLASLRSFYRSEDRHVELEYTRRIAA